MEAFASSNLSAIRIPGEVRGQWHRMLVTMAQALHVPTALIVSRRAQSWEVCASNSETGSPCLEGNTTLLAPYCETVTDTGKALFVPNVRQDPCWANDSAPDPGVVSYLGLPVFWPSGEVFGVICVADRQENSFAPLGQDLLEHFGQTVALSLSVLAGKRQLQMEAHEHQRTQAELAEHRRQLERLVEQRAAAMAQANEELKREMSQRQELQESLRLTRFSIDRCGDAVYWVGPDARLIDVNDAACQALGYTRQELLQMTVHDIDPDFPRQDWQEHWSRLKQEVSCTIESQHRAKEGRVFPVELSVSHVELDGKEYHCTFARDITKRKRALEALRESEERYREIVEGTGDLIARVDRRGRFTYVNHVAETVFGIPRNQCLGRIAFDFLHCDDQASMRRWFEECVRSRTRQTCIENRLVNQKTGEVCHVQWTSNFHFNADGQLEAVSGIARDITERKRTEERVRVANRFLGIATQHRETSRFLEHVVSEIRMLVGCAAVGIRLLDEEGNIPYQVHHGFSPQFYEQESPLSVHSDRCRCVDVVRGKVDARLPFFTEGGSFYTNALGQFIANASEQERLATRNGCHSAGFQSVALVPLHVEDRVLGLIHVADFQENKLPLATVRTLETISRQLSPNLLRIRAEQALRERELLFRSVFDSSLDGLVFVDCQGRFLDFNEAYLRLVGYTREELLGHDLGKITPPETLEWEKSHIIGQLREHGVSELYEKEYIHKDGHRVPIEVRACLVHGLEEPEEVVFAIARDVTRRKRAQEERQNLQRRLAEASKLQSLQLMAGSIAHDFNNLLCAVLGNLELAQNELPGDSPIEDLLKDSHEAASRAADLSTKMLTYSGHRYHSQRVFCVSQLVREARAELDATVRARVVIRYELCEDLPNILGNSAEIRQLLAELVKNAAEASGTSGGTIVVRTRQLAQSAEDDSPNFRGGAPPPGRYVVLEVEDAGAGMGVAEKRQMFDPFFTTRFLGGGPRTGVGSGRRYRSGPSRKPLGSQQSRPGNYDPRALPSARKSEYCRSAH